MADATPPYGMSHVRGEKPTRAGPLPVRKLLTALRLATGRGERTRAAPRGVVTKWSVNGKPVRSRMVAAERGTLTPLPWVVRRRFPVSFVGVQVDRPGGHRTCLPGSGGMMAACNDHENPHGVRGASRGKEPV